MEKIIILDFGSQYTQLIARRLRELQVYSEIHPYNKKINFSDDSIKGVILSGSPFSVNDENMLDLEIKEILDHKPVMGICYGAQLTAKQFGGKVEKSAKREYGKAMVTTLQTDPLLEGIAAETQVCLLYTSPSPRDATLSRMPSSA